MKDFNRDFVKKIANGNFNGPNPEKPDYSGKYNHIKGERCKICNIPIIQESVDKIIYGCMGCGRSFIFHENEWKTLEEYLDPDKILDFDNITGMSQEYMDLIKKEEKNQKERSLMAKTGVVLDFMEAYKPWSDLGFKCMQTGRIEEAIFCMTKALHDFYWNWGFWLNIAQLTVPLGLIEISKRAIRVVEIMDPNYEALDRIRTRIQMVELDLKNQINSAKTDINFHCNALTFLAEYNFRNTNFKRAIYRYQQLFSKFNGDYNDWMNYGGALLFDLRLKKSEKALKKALKLAKTDKNRAEVYFNLINLANVKNDKKQALKWAKKASSLDPNNLRLRMKIKEVQSWGKQTPLSLRGQKNR